MGVAPSRDGHGGCGQFHGRPVEHGAPVKLWALTCPQCETHLRHDDQWSATISGIPETPDEKAEREDRELRGQRDAAQATGVALDKIGNLPEALKEALREFALSMVGGTPGAAHASDALCLQGHPMASSAKFCGECGKAQAATVRDILTAVAPDPAPEPEDTPDFDALKIRELQAWAREREIKTAVSKADQIRLIREYLDAQG